MFWALDGNPNMNARENWEGTITEFDAFALEVPTSKVTAGSKKIPAGSQIILTAGCQGAMAPVPLKVGEL